MLDPGIWGDGEFAPQDPSTQVLYIGLITLAEDYGRVKGTPREFKVKIFPWGMVELDDIERGLKALLLSKLVVEYAEGYYFLPGWFSHQTQRYYAASKYPDIPKHVLDEHPGYRDAYYEAMHSGRVKRKDAAKDRRRVPTPATLNQRTLSEAMQIESMAEASEDDGKKVTAIMGMARVAKEEMTAALMKEYLSDLVDVPGDMVAASVAQLRKERPYLCRPSVIIEKVAKLFGKTSTKRPQRAIDADGLVLALSKGRTRFDDAVAALTDESRRANALMDVWDRMDQVSGGSVSAILWDIYSDSEMTRDRIVPVWQEITRRKKDEDDGAANDS